MITPDVVKTIRQDLDIKQWIVDFQELMDRYGVALNILMAIRAYEYHAATIYFLSDEELAYRINRIPENYNYWPDIFRFLQDRDYVL